MCWPVLWTGCAPIQSKKQNWVSESFHLWGILVGAIYYRHSCVEMWTKPCQSQGSLSLSFPHGCTKAMVYPGKRCNKKGRMYFWGSCSQLLTFFLFRQHVLWAKVCLRQEHQPFPLNYIANAHLHFGGKITISSFSQVSCWAWHLNTLCLHLRTIASVTSSFACISLCGIHAFFIRKTQENW